MSCPLPDCETPEGRDQTTSFCTPALNSVLQVKGNRLMLERVALVPKAISLEGFLPEETEGLGWEGEWSNSHMKKAKRFCSWRGIDDSSDSENLFSLCPQESGDDEYQGDQSDTEDEVDSDFDIYKGDEPSSDGEAEEPRRKRRVVTKAYKVLGVSWFSWTYIISHNFCCALHEVPVLCPSNQSNFLQC